MAPARGGQRLTAGAQKFVVVTPHAPMGAALVGQRAGDAVEVGPEGAATEYEVISVA